MSYITRELIKDKIIENFDIADYIEETENEINDLAETLGVSVDDIEDDPLHYKIIRYGVAFCLKRLCQDKTGANNVDLPDIEKYYIKYKMYDKDVKELKPQITREMFEGYVDEIKDRARVSGTLYRG